MTLIKGDMRPSGSLGIEVFRHPLNSPLLAEPTLQEIVHHGGPQKRLPDEVNAWRKRNLRKLLRDAQKPLLARKLHIPHFYGALWLKLIRADGDILDLGLASLKVVTDTGVQNIVDQFQGLGTALSNFKFHGLGTGTTAEAASQTALVTELTTQYQTDNTRPTGSQTENGANVYRTVGTVTVDAAVAATEHGLFSQAATGGGIMLDRSLFTVVNLASGDSLQGTYDLTINSGG